MRQPLAARLSTALLIVVAAVGSATLLARNPAALNWNRLSFTTEAALNGAGIVFVLALSTNLVNQHLGAVGKLIASSRQPIALLWN